MHEPLPLATIQEAILDFLRGRDDAALFGSQAVNAYVDEPRMTQAIDILSTRAGELAEELRALLAERFRVAVRVREVAGGRGYRVYQVQEPRNRHLADVRSVAALPAAERIRDVLVVTPTELVAGKVRALRARQGKPKSWTDRRDLAVLLLAFPELKREAGPVADRLRAAGADPATLAIWKELVAETILPEDDDSY